MKGYRTILFNVAAGLPMLADVLVATADEGLGGIIPPGWQAPYTAAVIFANVYLRMITTTPVGRSE